MELTDFSALKDERSGTPIRIPLNGVVYMADPNPAADVILEAIGAKAEDEVDVTLAAKMIAEGEDGLSTGEKAKLNASGMSATRRMLRFLDNVLEPQSLEKWLANMRPADPEWDARKRNAHEKVRITMPQLKAVFQALLAAYSGGPTAAPSSSSNGHGAAGPTSTAGAQPEG